MTGAVPAELVWFVGPASQAYDVMLYRAVHAEYLLAEALSGNPHMGMWVSWCHYEQRWEPWERAYYALFGTCAPPQHRGNPRRA
jgi:hypothetical protein